MRYILPCENLQQCGIVDVFRGLAGRRSLAAVLEARHANAMLVASAPPGLQPPDLERGQKLVRHGGRAERAKKLEPEPEPERGQPGGVDVAYACPQASWV